MLLVRIGGQTCALPLEHVEETMRPQPVRAMSDAPQFVRGLAIVRGMVIPVVDLTSLLGSAETPPARFVTVRAAGRRVALAVEHVLGVRDVPPESIESLPPLLAQAGEDVVEAIGTLDAELLMVLRSARLISEEAWARIEASDA